MQLRVFRHHNPAQTNRPLLDSFYGGTNKLRMIKYFLKRVFAYGLSALVMLLAPLCSYAQTTLGTQNFVSHFASGGTPL